MGVKRDFVEKLLFDFKESAMDILSSYNLDHMRGTNQLKPANSVMEDFKMWVTSTYAKEGVTASMLESEKRIYLNKLEKVALELSKGQEVSRVALQGKERKYTVSENIHWKPIVDYARNEIDRMVAQHGQFFGRKNQRSKALDAKFSRLLKFIDLSYRKDPSKDSAEDTMYSVKSSLRRIEGYINSEEGRKKRMDKKKIIDAMRKDRMADKPKAPALGYINGFTDGSNISGVFGTSSRPPIRGIGGNPSSGPLEYSEKQPGLFRRLGATIAGVGGAGLTVALVGVVAYVSLKDKNKATS